MSSVIGRQQLYQSFSESSSSGSVKFNRFEENSIRSNNIDYSPKSYEFWEKEESFEGFHTVHEPSICFFNFVDELKTSLNLKLPDYSFESLCKELKFRLQNIICCSVFEIKKTIESCYKVIQNFEDFNIKEGKILVGKFGFNLILDDKHSNFGNKEEIANDFMAVQSKSTKNREFLEMAQNFCSDLEDQMANSFYESIKLDKIKEVNTDFLILNSSFANELHNYRLRKVSLESCNMKKEIEWTKVKTRVLKVQLEKKLRDLKNKEDEIKLQTLILEEKLKNFNIKEEEIKAQTLFLRAEKQKLENDRSKIQLKVEELESKKGKFIQFQDCLKDLASALSKSILISDSTFQSQNFENNEDQPNLLNNKIKYSNKLNGLQKSVDKESTFNPVKIIEKNCGGVKFENEFSPIKINQNSSVPQNIKQSMLIKQDTLRPNSAIKKTKTLSLVYAPVLSANRNSPAPQMQSAYTRSPSNPVSSQKISHECKNKSICNSSSRNRLKSPVCTKLFYNQGVVNLDYDKKDEHEIFNTLELKKAKSNEKRKVSNNNAKTVKRSADNRFNHKGSFDIIKEESVQADTRLKDIEEYENPPEKMLKELDRKDLANLTKEQLIPQERFRPRNMWSDLAQRIESALKMIEENF